MQEIFKDRFLVIMFPAMQIIFLYIGISRVADLSSKLDTNKKEAYLSPYKNSL